MNKGKILQVRPGHDANCSAMSYIGHVLVSYGAYLVFLLALVAAQLVLLIRRLAAKPWIGRLRIALWAIPHLAAMPILWIWASNEGVTSYGSVVCIGALELALLISLGVGWVIIARRSRASEPKRLPPKVQQAAHFCPSCDADVAASVSTCPFCGFDLALEREQAARSAE